MNKDKIPKKISNIRVKGKCPRERLRLRWEPQVEKDITQMEGTTSEENERELWEDRDKWRNVVARQLT
jgi:hypothetical protein